MIIDIKNPATNVKRTFSERVDSQLHMSNSMVPDKLVLK